MLNRLVHLSQLFFLAFFLLLFLQARYPYDSGLRSDLFLISSPLTAITIMLASRSFIHELWPGLLILALTVPLGRFFCGWVCPLGTVIDAGDRLVRRRRSEKGGSVDTRFRSWKFFILTAVLVAALFSLQWTWLFDPIALLTRVLTIVLYPALAFVVFAVFNAGFRLQVAEDSWYALYDSLQKHLLPVSQPRFLQSILILILFLAILLLAFKSRRFWCRNLCPLGALLGLFSRFRLVKRNVSAACNQCAVCRRTCRMNAIEDDYSQTNTAECIECSECAVVCKPAAVSYGVGQSRQEHYIDFSRRRFVQASVSSVAVLAVVQSAAKNRNQTGQVIRPPGSLTDEDFLDRCIRCQACVRICASTGACLQPSLTESGWEGFWSPRLEPRLGYCEYNCDLCGQVCPTGAIQKLPLPEKQKIKMGTAFFDKSRCIPWYRQEDCLVCEEHCPLPDKAIKFDIREVRAADGQVRTVKFPNVREEICTGCGICETKCPVIGKSAIFVTAAGEQRLQARAGQEGM